MNNTYIIQPIATSSKLWEFEWQWHNKSYHFNLRCNGLGHLKSKNQDLKPIKGENIVKVATQVGKHFLKLYIFIFEKSRKEHNNFDYQYLFSNRLHYLGTFFL
jgi:predicted SprT family Zn-dependent metalloprotease